MRPGPVSCAPRAVRRRCGPVTPGAAAVTPGAAGAALACLTLRADGRCGRGAAVRACLPAALPGAAGAAGARGAGAGWMRRGRTVPALRRARWPRAGRSGGGAAPPAPPAPAGLPEFARVQRAGASGQVRPAVVAHRAWRVPGRSGRPVPRTVSGRPACRRQPGSALRLCPGSVFRTCRGGPGRAAPWRCSEGGCAPSRRWRAGRGDPLTGTGRACGQPRPSDGPAIARRWPRLPAAAQGAPRTVTGGHLPRPSRDSRGGRGDLTLADRAPGKDAVARRAWPRGPAPCLVSDAGSPAGAGPRGRLQAVVAGSPGPAAPRYAPRHRSGGRARLTWDGGPAGAMAPVLDRTGPCHGRAGEPLGRRRHRRPAGPPGPVAGCCASAAHGARRRAPRSGAACCSEGRGRCAG